MVCFYYACVSAPRAVVHSHRCLCVCARDPRLSRIVVDKLQDQGISVGDINKLKGEGLMTLGGVLRTTRKSLLAVKGLSEAKVDKIVAACKKLDTTTGFKSGKEMMHQRSQVIKLSTGSKELDKLLVSAFCARFPPFHLTVQGGGIETMSITEAFGEFRTGKTQIAHNLCITAQLPLEMNGGNGKVAYIDTGTYAR
jgi:meiotic recombination protein DMC1